MKTKYKPGDVLIGFEKQTSIMPGYKAYFKITHVNTDNRAYGGYYTNNRTKRPVSKHLLDSFNCDHSTFWKKATRAELALVVPSEIINA